MQTLARTLADYDLELIRVIAARWDVELKARDPKKAAETLAKAILQPAKVEDMWRRLDDDQRGALQALLGSGGKMGGVMYGRMFGEIRPMGPGKLEREKPYLTPVSINEALYYRGLVAFIFSDTPKGQQPFAYIPSDLAPLLPKNETSYKAAAQPEVIEPIAQPENVRQADTAMVDDLTTLMAYCQLVDVKLIDGGISADHQKTIKPYFIGSSHPARLSLMIGLALDMGIASITQGSLKTVGGVLKTWLEAPRAAQVKALAEAWKLSTRYNEMAFTPGLKVERLNNDPLLARQTVLTFMETVPPNGWWPVDEFVSNVKEEEPEFQRPTGEYDSWYIRDGQSNQYLRGFESWDKVDGAMLRFILTGPMHGLGLLDTAQNGALCRLTAYGRAFTGETEWPAPQAETTPIVVRDDGMCDVPRAASRFERFQLSRFTEWLKGGDPYQYRISADGLAQATQQNIKAEQLLAFLKRATNNAVPKSVTQLIETWAQAGTQSAQLSRLVVLRLPTPELLETLMNNPAVRRYLGAALGPAAVAVRADQWEGLVSALQSNGIMVEVDMG
ncbi:MAG: helicase-associated domain-containing protein [Anaerolineae bacterium]|nr:helicase-associated domain-containing protein [Anaerolineae bacterium]